MAETPTGSTIERPVDWQAERLGPTSSIAALYVGHSLVNARVAIDGGTTDLMSLIGEFARAKGLALRAVDHTLWGSPLSALWRGRPHGYDRDAAAMVEKRQAFEREAGTYDTMVLTEIVPLRHALLSEFSSYYLRRFFCVLKRANPQARAYVYETWVNFQPQGRDATSGTSQMAAWRHEMQAQRRLWEELADAASRPAVRTPGWLARFGLAATTDAGCRVEAPIFMVPVGSVLLQLAARLADPRPTDRFEQPDGSRVRIANLFANPYVDLPEAGGAADGETRRRLRDPSQPHDDIHPSALGVYVSAIVHFATLYRQSPVGLPYPNAIGAPLARTLQCIAWDTVLADPRSGVAGSPQC